MDSRVPEQVRAGREEEETGEEGTQTVGRWAGRGGLLLSFGLGQGNKFLTATVGLWLRTGGLAPAVAGRGGKAGLLGSEGAGSVGGVEALDSEGAGLTGGAGLGQRLRARWRMRCRKSRGRAASLPSESRLWAAASSDLTPLSMSKEQRC